MSEDPEATASAVQDRLAGAQRRLAAAELRAAGVPAELVDHLDLSRVLDADGEVDADRVASMGQKYAAMAPAPARRMAANPAQGTSAGGQVSTEAGRIAVARQLGGTSAVIKYKARQALGGSGY